jgi:hypothetical protein
VALIKPTTSYFWFLVTFCRNWICGLAVCLLFFYGASLFLRELPVLSKTKNKTKTQKQFRRGMPRSPANFVDYVTPPAGGESEPKVSLGYN